MSEIVLQQASSLGVPRQQIKPPYLVRLVPPSGKKLLLFLAFDKPTFHASHIETKGYFVEMAEEDLIKNVEAILTSTKSELICEMMYPLHRVFDVKNILYKPKTK